MLWRWRSLVVRGLGRAFLYLSIYLHGANLAEPWRALLSTRGPTVYEHDTHLIRVRLEGQG